MDGPPANYSTDLLKVVTSGATGRDHTRTKRLPGKPLLTIEQVGDGMEFLTPEA